MGVMERMCCLGGRGGSPLNKPQLCPRDSPGRNTGAGCHCLLQGSPDPGMEAVSPAWPLASPPLCLWGDPPLMLTPPLLLLPGLQKAPCRALGVHAPVPCDPGNGGETISHQEGENFRSTYAGPWFSRFSFLSNAWHPLNRKKTERVRFVCTFK